MDHESVQATALKAVFDLLHVFGFEAFNMGADPSKFCKENTLEVLYPYVQPRRIKLAFAVVLYKQWIVTTSVGLRL